MVFTRLSSPSLVPGGVALATLPSVPWAFPTRTHTYTFAKHSHIHHAYYLTEMLGNVEKGTYSHDIYTK